MLKFPSHLPASSFLRRLARSDRAQLSGPGFEVSEVDWSVWEESVSAEDGGGEPAPPPALQAAASAPVQVQRGAVITEVEWRHWEEATRQR